MDVDKTLILNKIQKFYNFDKDKDFASFLGIKIQVLSNWKARNTFDIEILYTKCLDISSDFLISGIGTIERNSENYNEKITVVNEDTEKYIVTKKSDVEIAQQKTIAVLEREIDDLRNDKNLLYKIIEVKLLIS